MTMHDLYAQMGLDKSNIRSRKAIPMINRHAVRRVLKQAHPRITLDHIAQVEADIHGGKMGDHTSIRNSWMLTPFALLIRAEAQARRLYIVGAPVEILLTKTQPQWRA
jgi:hypothetical protein